MNAASKRRGPRWREDATRVGTVHEVDGGFVAVNLDGVIIGAFRSAIAKMQVQADTTKVPTDLAKKVETFFKEHPSASWESAIAALADRDYRRQP